jgi:hypothetical protein
VNNSPLQTVRAECEALLLEPLLQPLESAFGAYGSIVAQSFADALAKGLS